MQRALLYGDIVQFRSKATGQQPVEGVVVGISFPLHASNCWTIRAYSAVTGIMSELVAFGGFHVVRQPELAERQANVETAIAHYRMTLAAYPVWAETLTNPDWKPFPCQGRTDYWENERVYR